MTSLNDRALYLQLWTFENSNRALQLLEILNRIPLLTLLKGKRSVFSGGSIHTSEISSLNTLITPSEHACINGLAFSGNARVLSNTSTKQQSFSAELHLHLSPSNDAWFSCDDTLTSDQESRTMLMEFKSRQRAVQMNLKSGAISGYPTIVELALCLEHPSANMINELASTVISAVFDRTDLISLLGCIDFPSGSAFPCDVRMSVPTRGIDLLRSRFDRLHERMFGTLISFSGINALISLAETCCSMVQLKNQWFSVHFAKADIDKLVANQNVSEVVIMKT